MKKILVVLIFAFATVCTFAEGHMKFMGVEIDGTLQSFAAKLKERGFRNSLSETYVNGWMEGYFAGQNVTLCIYSSKKSNIVYAVSVIFNSFDSWPRQEEHYKNLANSLKEKYGEPIKDIWNVAELNPQYSLKEGYSVAEMHFAHSCGGVKICIDEITRIRKTVSTRIFYWDAKNKAKYKAEVESDL